MGKTNLRTINIENMKRPFTTNLFRTCAARAMTLSLVAMLLTLGSASAQVNEKRDINEIVKLKFEARFDYIHDMIGTDQRKDMSGFNVRYINMLLDGNIGDKFSYSWRQRLNKMYSAKSFVDNMDWLYLAYRPTQNWEIAAGKQVVMIGGWEYDRAPIDLYFCSEYWNNVACYQFGASVAFMTNKGNDKLTLQVCQSPYDNAYENLFAFNLHWMGSHGCYTALHSLNFSEYHRGKYAAYITLGNRFRFGDATIQLDLMNRGASAKELLFDNFSIMGEFSYLIADRVNVFARATYDKVGDNYPVGLFVYPNTNMTRVGGGVEYYPLGGRGNRDIRLHAAYAYSFGENGRMIDGSATARDKQSYLTVGLTWRIDVMSAVESIIDKAHAKRAAKLQ